jgi:hypothetical protein
MYFFWYWRVDPRRSLWNNWTQLSQLPYVADPAILDTYNSNKKLDGESILAMLLAPKLYVDNAVAAISP